LYREIPLKDKVLRFAMTGLLTLYQSITRAGWPFLELLLKMRMRRGKEDPARLPERMGSPSRARPQGRVVWVHAASVGEAQSAMILINAMGGLGENINVLVTTGTTTSATLMERRLPAFAFHQYVPLDHPVWVGNFLNHWKPDLALWMESELWPNTLLALKERNIPAVLINARLSDKSFRNWSYAKDAAQKVIGCFGLIFAQTEKDASHYRALGAKNVTVSDNIKYSAAPLPHDEIALSALKLSIGERRVWVYASTHAAEEALSCRVHKTLKEKIPDLLTIIVPRHPQRREEIAGVCFENGVKFTLRSNNTALPAIDDDIYIVDTLGELGLFYTLCDIAMIGRSFSDDGGGGHNPVEAAQLGCAVITGPNNQYQRQIYDDMQDGGAVIQVGSEEELVGVLDGLFSNPEKLAQIKNQTENFTACKVHVIDRVLEHLSPFLRDTESRNAA
jgi:3-deoxy-D-manno-octulosonic-acid transferase